MLGKIGIIVATIITGSSVAFAQTDSDRSPQPVPTVCDFTLPWTTPTSFISLAPTPMDPDIDEPSPSDMLRQSRSPASYPTLDSNDGDCYPSCWIFQADVLLLQRSAGRGNTLGQTSVVPGGRVIETLNSNDATFPFRTGIRLALNRQIDCETSWQLVYFGTQNWSGSRTIFSNPGAGILATSPYTQVDNLLGGFDGSLGYSYTSRLHNAEFNRLRLRDDSGAWTLKSLAGFRYFQWNDNLTLSGFDPFFGVTENVSSRAGNHLVGGQIGGVAGRSWDRFTLDFTGKAGLFANFIQQGQSNLSSTGIGGIPGPPAFVPINTSRRTTGVAGLIDFSAIGTYQLRQNFALRGGYQLLYVAGLALGPAQLNGPSHNSDVFLHGPTGGMEFTW